MAEQFTVDHSSPEAGKIGVFREVRSGAWMTRVMSRSTYDKASDRANTALERAIRHPPTTPKR